MKKLALTVILASVSVAAAQATPPATPASTNPLDLSEYKDIAAGKVLPSPQGVNNIRAQAEAMVKANKCKEALSVLDTWATQANWLGNLISSGLEPFYNAAYSDRKNVDSSVINVLAPYENQANGYKEQRNLATVMKAECLAKLGRKNEAAAVYARALDLINHDDTVLWNRATAGLYTLIGVKPPKF